MLRVGVAQLQASRSKEEAAERIRRLLAGSRVEADLIVFPEYSMLDPTGLSPGEVAEAAEDLDGPWAKMLEGLAAEHGAYVAGTLFTRGRRKPRNTVVVFSPSGGVVAVYSKTHLFDAYGYRESEVFEPGDGLAEPFEVRGVRLGLAVCFELRFPEVFRVLALRGAHAFIVPAAWYAGPLKEETLHVLARARSHENGAYTIVAALWGERFTGRSVVVDPLGVPVADLGIGEKYLETLIDTRAVEEARRLVPVLELRRPKLYEDLIGAASGRASS